MINQQQPTKEQKIEFWEWCGVDFDKFYINNGYEVPPIDLNNLFKYAVPKLVNRGYTVILSGEKAEYPYGAEITKTDLSAKAVLEQDEDPALALFWAIHPIIDKSPPL